MTDITELKKFIEKTVTENDIVLFMKGTADFPQCGFSGQAVQILQYMAVDFITINILTDDALRQAIKEYSDWPTLPQLYVKGEFIGGVDIMKDMFQNHELEALFRDKNIPSQRGEFAPAP